MTPPVVAGRVIRTAGRVIRTVAEAQRLRVGTTDYAADRIAAATIAARLGVGPRLHVDAAHVITMQLNRNDRPMRRCEGAIEGSRRRLSLCNADAEHRGG